MTTDECKQVAREFLEAVGRHDVDRARSLLADDATIWAPGAPFMAPDLYFGAMQALIERSTGAWEMTIGPMVGEGSSVAVETEMRAPLRHGKVYSPQAHIHFELEGGRITVIREYVDMAHLQETFDGRDPILGRPPRYSAFTGQRTL